MFDTMVKMHSKFSLEPVLGSLQSSGGSDFQVLARFQYSASPHASNIHLDLMWSVVVPGALY